MGRSRVRTALLAGAMLSLAGAAGAQTDPLKAAFADPPNEARPRVWWHWLDGDVSRHGIDEDLAWMKRVGLGGVQTFDGGFGTPLLVPHPVVFMTPEWKEDFRDAVETAAANGFEVSIASSPGWSESGGPWVKPEQAMKKLVWTETLVEGGKPFKGRLAEPPAEPGPFGNVPLGGGTLGGDASKATSLYRDSVVVAFRAPASELAPKATITASSPIDVARLTDGDLATPVALPFGPGDGSSWVQFDYRRPQTIRALKLAAEKAGGHFGFGDTGPAGRIEASDDGHAFRRIADLPTDGAPEQTVAFPAVTARYFRVVFAPRGPSAGLPGLPPPPTPTAHRIAELVFESAARVHRFEDKAGWSVLAHLETQPTPQVAPADAVAPGATVDLTGRMRPDGSLDWTPPPGRWIVLRMGWSPTGITNHPASPAGTGLEVDKLNAKDVRAYVEAYLDAYAGAAGPQGLGPHGVASMVTDSYEAGAANWTDDILAQFKARRGYDPTPWLPVLTGRVVGSAPASEAFLWDFRKTLGDLIAEAHYGEISAALHARGMRRYGEAHEDNRAFIGDGMEVKKSADIPMGAMWAQAPPPTTGAPRPTNYDADLRESASVAHLYGQNLVAAESFTTVGSAYDFDPQRLKPAADRMLADGVNHFSIHTSAHQPTDDPGPGIGLGPFGQWFTRHETWAEMAGPWVSYLARSSEMLQQGRFAADVLWFYGEDDNITALYGEALPPVPPGYAFDFVNADAVQHLLSVKDGRITAPSGASYRMLALAPQARRMSLATLTRIRDLVQAGAVVAGAKPEVDVSLADDPAAFRAMADALWGGQTGKGRVIANPDLGAALAQMGVAPDVDGGLADLRFVHRKLADGEVYFVSNPAGEARALALSFRVAGKAAELWRADTGAIEPASYAIEAERTRVPLKLGAHEAVFVVFRAAAAQPRRTIAEPVTREVARLEGGWTLALPAASGGTGAVQLPALRSWTNIANPRIKYFSGTAVYRTTFNLPAEAVRPGGRLVLELGEVKNLAEARLNGKPVGIAWKAPFELDLGGSAKAGANVLEVRVANLWPNRLIGDRQPGAAKHATATFDPFGPDAPLLPSGLLGPVRVLSISPAP